MNKVMWPPVYMAAKKLEKNVKVKVKKGMNIVQVKVLKFFNSHVY